MARCNLGCDYIECQVSRKKFKETILGIDYDTVYLIDAFSMRGRFEMVVNFNMNLVRNCRRRVERVEV